MHEATENMYMFYSFYKIIFRLKKGKKKRFNKRLYVIFYFFHETVNQWHSLETANNIIAHVILALHRAMKTHLLTNQNARTMQIIL